MKQQVIKKILLLSPVIIIGILVVLSLNHNDTKAVFCVSNSDDLSQLFPQTVNDIKQREQQALNIINGAVADILSIRSSCRNFANSGLVLDRAKSKVSVIIATLESLKYLSPNDEIRAAAQAASAQIMAYSREKISLNQQLYNNLVPYIEQALKTENLANNERYFLQELLADFNRAGLNLPSEQLEQVTQLLSELEALSTQYMINLSQDQSKISVAKKALAGLPDDFVAKLNVDHDFPDHVLVSCDDNSYVKVMSMCTNAATREKLYRTYVNRAYPQNIDLLKTIISKRDQLAQKLGFASYNHLDLDDQMVKNPEQAREFLLDLLPAVQAKAQGEIKTLIQELPASVKLNRGQIQPWDTLFIKNSYKLQHLQVDDNLVREYFPVQTTIERLLKIYESFFDLHFEQINVAGLWSDDVASLAVYRANDHTLLGYLLLDLYPRPNKLSHAGVQICVVPAVLPLGQDNNDDLSGCPAVSIVVTNFPKATASQPALLSYTHVRTFFHEFGHAMHAILGRTMLASQAGVNVKVDFVEMPSQMLECWLLQPEILAQVSAHYQTGEPIPQKLISQIIKAQTFDIGDNLLAQLNSSLMALDLYAAGENKNLEQIRARLATNRPYMVHDPQNQSLASFIHIALPEYGPKVYGYLWSRVFASDIFAQIKAQGLDSPIAGRKYVEQIIGRGGECDPNQLLIDFLGRKPSQEAFRQELGLI